MKPCHLLDGKGPPPVAIDLVDSFHLMVAPKGARYESHGRIPLALAVRTWKSGRGELSGLSGLVMMCNLVLALKAVFGSSTYKLALTMGNS